MSTKRTAVATDSEDSISKEPVIKSLAEKCSVKNKDKRSKRLKIHHRNSRDDSDEKDCEEDGHHSYSKTRSKSRTENIKVQSSTDRNLKDTQLNDNTEQSKIDEENVNKTEHKSRIKNNDEINDHIMKSVKSREREVTKRNDDRSKNEKTEYVKIVSQNMSDIKYFPKSGIQYTKSKPVVMYSRNLVANRNSHVQSKQQMLETSPKVEVIPGKYRLETKPNDLKENSSADKSKNVCDTMNIRRPNNFKRNKKNMSEGVLRKEHEKKCTSTSNISNNYDDCINIDKSLRLNNETLCPLNTEEIKSGAQKLPDMSVEKHVGQNEKTEQLETADKSKNVCDTMNVLWPNNFKRSKKNMSEGVLRKEHEKNCTSTSNISNKYDDCVNIDKSLRLNNETLCPLNTEENKSGAQKLPDMSVEKHVGQNEKTEQLETAVKIIRNIDEFMENKFTDKKLGILVKTGVDMDQNFRNDFRQLKSIQDKKERQNFYVNHCLTNDPYRHILETNSNTFQCCTQLPPKYDFVLPTCTDSIAITPTSENKKEDESTLSMVVSNAENDREIIEEEIAALSDSERPSDSNTVVLRHDNSYVGMSSVNREDETESISSYDFRSIENNLDDQSTMSDLNETEENNNSAQMVLQDTTVGLLYNVHNNSNVVLDIEIQNQPNIIPMNYVNDQAEYYYYLRNRSDRNSNYYYYYQSYGSENYRYYYAANPSDEYTNYYYRSINHENYNNYMRGGSPYVDNHNYYYYYYYQPFAPQNGYDHYYASNSSNEYGNYYYQPSAPQNGYDNYRADNSSNDYNNYYYQSGSQSQYNNYYTGNSSNDYNNNYYQSSGSQSHYDHYSEDPYNSRHNEPFGSVDYRVQENSFSHSVNTIPVLEFNGIPSVAVTQVEDEFQVYPPLYIADQNDHDEFSNENNTSVDQYSEMVDDQISYRHEQNNENSRTCFNIHIVTESINSSYRSSSSSSNRSFSSSSSNNRSSSFSSDISNSSDISSSSSDYNSSSDDDSTDFSQASLSLPLLIVHHSSCCGMEVPSDDENTVYVSCPCVSKKWTNKPHAVVRPFEKDSSETDSSDESSQY